MPNTIYARAERLAIDPFQTRPAGGELEILDAEIVDVTPWAPTPERSRSVVLDDPPEPHWLNPRYNPEPYLLTTKWLLIAAIPVVLAWGLYSVLTMAATAVTEHAQGIEQAGAGIGIGFLALMLMGGGGAACAGLHCGGCRR